MLDFSYEYDAVYSLPNLYLLDHFVDKRFSQYMLKAFDDQNKKFVMKLPSIELRYSIKFDETRMKKNLINTRAFNRSWRLISGRSKESDRFLRMLREQAIDLDQGDAVIHFYNQVCANKKNQDVVISHVKKNGLATSFSITCNADDKLYGRNRLLEESMIKEGFEKEGFLFKPSQKECKIKGKKKGSKAASIELKSCKEK